MRMILRILTIAIILIPVTIGSCKKQPKCGCDKDKIRSFAGIPVQIYYDEENKSAKFYLVGDLYSTYHFCNPTEMMDKLTSFENGEEILVDCDIFWECSYIYQASNSYYTSMYKVYMVTVYDLREDLYGK